MFMTAEKRFCGHFFAAWCNEFVNDEELSIVVALIQSGFGCDVRMGFGDDETETVKHHGGAGKTEIGSDSCGCLLGAERLWVEG